jgi:lipopolysaccharide export LptBFGC system permease protein LptF
MRLEVSVPESLNEVTLEQYQKFDKINTEENQDSNFLLHKTVEIFCNLDLKDIAKIRVSSIKEILSDIDNIFVEKPELIPLFNLNGTEYGFIPKLDDITIGEFIDLDENLSDWSTMHKAMAVLYRPTTFNKNGKYLIEEYEGQDNAELFKAMPLDVAMGAMVFFYRLNNELLETTLNYLNREVPNQMNTELLATLERSGDGINLSMHSLREMLPASMTLPD